jgi:hypothetical protein
VARRIRSRHAGPHDADRPEAEPASDRPGPPLLAAVVGRHDQQHRRRRLRGLAAAAGRDHHPRPAAHRGRHRRDVPAVAAALAAGRRRGRPLRPGHAHVAGPGRPGRGRGGAGHPDRLPPGRNLCPRPGRLPARQRRGHLRQRRAVGAPRAGPARPAAQGQRPPADKPDRGRVIPRPARGQPAVRGGRGAAVRAGRRLVRRLIGARGRPAQVPPGQPRLQRAQDPRPDRRGAALADAAPPAARGRRPARHLQLRQPDGPGRPGAAGHPDAARRHPRLRLPAGGERRRQRARRPDRPAADPSAGHAALADHRGRDRRGRLRRHRAGPWPGRGGGDAGLPGIRRHHVERGNRQPAPADRSLRAARPGQQRLPDDRLGPDAVRRAGRGLRRARGRPARPLRRRRDPLRPVPARRPPVPAGRRPRPGRAPGPPSGPGHPVRPSRRSRAGCPRTPSAARSARRTSGSGPPPRRRGSTSSDPRVPAASTSR